MRTLAALACILVGLVSARPAAQTQPADPGRDEPRTPIPPITDADREAAFPDVEPHAMGDRAIHAFVLANQLEWQAAEPTGGANWDAKGWIGGDLNRVWFRSEGETQQGHLGHAEAHLLYGRAVARWWDLVIGARHDVGTGPPRTWAALGVQGLAPYWFEVEATGYISDGGLTSVRLAVEYELLATNRIVIQPLLELDLFGTDDPARGIGAGFSSTEVGLRVRYELRRELAPYLGITWNTLYGDTRAFAEREGGDLRTFRVVGGVRVWY